MIFEKRVTIIQINKPHEKDINKELQWFGSSLGLFNLRDKDKSCFRIFITLLKSAKIQEPLSSDEIAEKLDLSRGTVVHHINKLMNSGLVIKEKNKYMLRVDNLSELVEEIHKDMSRTCKTLRDVAQNIDNCLGL